MAFAALMFVIWFALGIGVVGLLNVAKWTARDSKLHDHADVVNRSTWPAPQPTSGFEPAPATARPPAHSQVRGVDLEPTSRR